MSLIIKEEDKYVSFTTASLQRLHMVVCGITVRRLTMNNGYFICKIYNLLAISSSQYRKATHN